MSDSPPSWGCGTTSSEEEEEEAEVVMETEGAHGNTFLERGVATSTGWGGKASGAREEAERSVACPVRPESAVHGRRWKETPPLHSPAGCHLCLTS